MSRHKCTYWIVTLAVIFITFLSGCTSTTISTSKVYNLTFASKNPPNSIDYKVRQGWINYLKEASGGRINITVTSAGQPDQYLQMVRAGIVDMADFSEVRTPGLLPLHEILQLPFIFDIPECRVAALAQYSLENKYPEFAAEISGVKSWPLGRRGSFQIFTRDKPIHTLDDMKGVSLIIRGTIQSEVTKLLGAKPVDIGDTMWYGSISQGLVEGINNNYQSHVYIAETYKVCNYATEISASGGSAIQIMNLDIWNSLPADLQQLLDEIQLTYVEVYGYALDQIALEAKNLIDESLKARGYDGVYILPSEEKVLWIDAVEPIFETWVQNATPIVGEDKARMILSDIVQLSKTNVLTEEKAREYDKILHDWGVSGY